jgi:hypothetical protein
MRPTAGRFEKPASDLGSSGMIPLNSPLAAGLLFALNPVIAGAFGLNHPFRLSSTPL